jgi:Ca2+-binding RTX toxin-like protein
LEADLLTSRSKVRGAGGAGCFLAAALLSTALSVFFPASAEAATALVERGDRFRTNVAVRYLADAGESNRVTVTAAPDGSFALVITDPGATIEVGPGCTSLAANRARCSFLEGTLEVELADGDDSLSLLDADAFQASFSGGGGDDVITGEGPEGIEYLFGGPGNDRLFGREGDDVLDGGLGADRLSGGSSEACGTAGICHPNIDTVTYARRTRDISVDTDGVADDGEMGEGDLVRSDIEAIIGGSGDDVLVGTTTVTGFVEERRFRVGTHLGGRGGNDVLRGGRSGNALFGGQGNDILRGGRGGDLLKGASGNDRLVGGRHRDGLRGGQGNDVLGGGGGQDVMRGDRGHDRLVGGPDHDRLFGASGRDLLLAKDQRRDLVHGGIGSDRARVDRGLDAALAIESLF